MEFKLTKVVTTLTRVSKFGNSYYVLIPIAKVKELRLSNRDYVVMLMAEFIDLILREAVKETERIVKEMERR